MNEPTKNDQTDLVVDDSTVTTKTSSENVIKFPLFKSRDEMRFLDYIHNYFLESISAIFWVYLVSKLFIFDLDIFFFERFLPEYLWLLNFKLLLILIIGASVLVFCSKRGIIIWLFYILFYPFVLLVKISIFVFKQKSWTLAFALINTVISFFKSFKRNFIGLTLYVLFYAIIIFLTSNSFLTVATIGLLMLVAYTYVYKFVSALKPSAIFVGYTKLFKVIRKYGKTSFELDEELHGLQVENLDEKQVQKWTEVLQTTVLFNRVCLFTATKLRDYQRSSWRIIPSILSLLSLIFYSVISFSGIYYALYKINSSLFTYSVDPTFFTFFYFSFTNMVFGSIDELSVASPISQSVYMFQTFLVLILGLIFATLILSYRTQKYSQELSEVISQVEKEASSMEGHIGNQFGIADIQTAIEHLGELKSSLLNLIYKLSKKPEV